MVRLKWLAMLGLLLLTACDSKPEHYYAMCEGQDGGGWSLINTEYEDGYLIACTYQSPDRAQVYTARCGKHGCD